MIDAQNLRKVYKINTKKSGLKGASLLCFFTTGYLGISWMRTALFEFFSGAMIPVALFPGWLKTAACCTPFPYMIQVLVAVLLGQDTMLSLPGAYGMQVIWILVFLVPYGFICVVPVEILRGSASLYWNFALPAVSIGFFLLARAVFYRGIRHYESVGM